MSQETEKQGFWVLHTQAAYLVNYKLADCIVLRPKDAQISFVRLEILKEVGRVLVAGRCGEGDCWSGMGRSGMGRNQPVLLHSL